MGIVRIAGAVVGTVVIDVAVLAVAVAVVVVVLAVVVIVVVVVVVVVAVAQLVKGTRRDGSGSCMSTRRVRSSSWP